MADIEVFVPGRLCILGEHSDWAAEYRDVNPTIAYGMTLVCATNEGLYAKCRGYTPGHMKFEFVNGNGNIETFDMSLNVAELIKKAELGGFFSYVAGAAAAVILDYFPGGATSPYLEEQGIYIINYKTTLPMRKGLSSSAAVCVLVVKCFNETYGLGMTQADFMEAAYRGEMMTPSRCGRMDQCVAMGSGSIGLMSFDVQGCQLRVLPCREPLYFVVADLKAAKDTVVILKALNGCFPFPADSIQSRMHRYVSNNQKLCWMAAAAVETGNVSSLASVMMDAQQAFNQCAIENCREQLMAPRLREVMNNPALRRVSLAIKGVGSQGDGTVQVLCKGPEEQRQAMQILNTDLGCDAFLLTVPVALPSPERPILHPYRVRCAMVIVDPKATQRYATLGALCPPCLLPLPWLHGCSAMLLSVLQELIACGVQRIAVVVPVAPSIQDLTTGGAGNNNGPGPVPGPGPGNINAASINALPAHPVREPSSMLMVRPARPSFGPGEGPVNTAALPVLGGGGGQSPGGLNNKSLNRMTSMMAMTHGQTKEIAATPMSSSSLTNTTWQYLSAMQPPPDYLDEEELDADLGDFDDDDIMGDAAASSHHHSHSRKPNKTPTSSSSNPATAATAGGVDASNGRAAKREGRSTFSGAFNALGFGSKASTTTGGETQTLLPGGATAESSSSTASNGSSGAASLAHPHLHKQVSTGVIPTMAKPFPAVPNSTGTGLDRIVEEKKEKRAKRSTFDSATSPTRNSNAEAQAGPAPAPGLFKMLSYRFAGAGAGSAPVVASGVGQSIPEDAEVNIPSPAGAANAQGSGPAVNPMVASTTTSPSAPSAGAAAAAAILANAAAVAATTSSSPPKKQPVAASAPTPSSSGFDWTYGKEQFELIKARVRFFIEDVDNYEASRHDTILEAVKTLHAAAKRLNATQTPAAGGSSAAAASGKGPSGSGQPATTPGTTQQQPYRKLESSFDMNALKTGATGAGSRRGLGADHGSPDSIVGHLLVVRAECLPRAWAGPAANAPRPTTPVGHNTSVASVLTKPNPIEQIPEVREGLHGFLRAAMDAGSRSGDVYPAPFVALNVPSSHDAATGVNGAAYPTHKNHHPKTSERILRLDLDNAFKPTTTNSIKEFMPPVDPHHTRVPAEVKVATSTTTAVTNHGARGPVENGLNFGSNNQHQGNHDGMFEFGGMALVSYQDAITYLGGKDEEELPMVVRRMHPVDAIVHGVLSQREAGRAKEQHEWQVRLEDHQRKLQGEDIVPSTIGQGPDKGDIAAMLSAEVALESVALGVMVKGTLSVMDEMSYRKATITAATGRDPDDDSWTPGSGQQRPGKELRKAKRKEQRAARRSQESASVGTN